MVSRMTKGLAVLALIVGVGMLLGPASTLAGDDTFSNRFGMEFVKIESGSFTMGGDETEKYSDVMPAHEVKITKDFYLGKFEITRQQYAEVMGLDTDKLDKPDHPQVLVTYNDIQLFLLKLNAKEGTEAYRLPTEAEWEYACRAGTTTKYSFGDDVAQLKDYAWYYDSAKFTNPVGQLKPNAWGLYDMHGNVFEWCNDFYLKEYYKDSPKNDPENMDVPEDAKKLPPRIIRGGGWYSKAHACTSAYRSNSLSAQKFIGFRLVKIIE